MVEKQQTIAFFSGYYLPFLGGIERYTDKLSAELVAQGYRVIIVATNHENLPNREENNGRVIYRLPSKKLFKQRYPILDKNQEYKELMGQLSQENIDFVICNTRFQLTTLTGLKFAKEQGIPAIVLDHGSSHFTVNNKILDVFGAIYEHALTMRVKSYEPRFYGVSQRCVEWLKHFRIKADGVIYNSVSATLADDFLDKELLEKVDGDIFITYAGRILKEKGVEMLLEAFTKAQFPANVKLKIAGDGPEFERLTNQYTSSNIQFLGKLDFEDTMSLMAQSDIFVYPSMYPEGLPTSILEAGLLKCAVIATDRGGTVEVITDDSVGTIIEENVDSLEKALRDLVTDEAKRYQLQETISQRVKNQFTWKVTAKGVEEVVKRNEKI